MDLTWPAAELLKELIHRAVTVEALPILHVVILTVITFDAVGQVEAVETVGDTASSAFSAFLDELVLGGVAVEATASLLVIAVGTDITVG